MLLIQPPIKPATKEIHHQVSFQEISSSSAHHLIEKRRIRTLLFFRKILSMLLRRKWIVLLTTLFISLMGITSYLLMGSSNITIRTVLLVGVLSGLLLGSVLAFIGEWRNSLLVSQDDLQESTGYQVIGVIPEAKCEKELLVKKILDIPYSRIAEAYRLTATMLLHGEHNTIHAKNSEVILITSINAGEGKSVSATNIAYFLAELGRKVLLVDCDLRMPSVHFKLGIQNKLGLINYLQGKEKLPDITQQIFSMSGLFVITAGSALKFSPVNLLSQPRMNSFLSSASQYFDYVILDAPPVRGFADTLLLHSMASSTVVVVPEKKVQIDTMKSNLKPLLKVKHSIVGLLKVMATKDTVDKDYYKKYSNASSSTSRFRLSKKKLNLGGRKY